MRRARWAVVAVAVLLLSGCATIPTTGLVRPGATSLPNDPSIVFVPNPPAAGANQREIVTGFLTAASAGGDFDVARQYLASSFAAKWHPRTRVLVQDGQTGIDVTSDQDLTVDVPISGRLDERGYYTPATRTTPLPFHLVQQGGQWRIDAAPDGIVLGQTVFQKVYTPRVLQFFDPTWKRLVPDRRWFPTAVSDETLVQALIDGPVGPVGSGVAVNALSGAKLGGVLGTDVTTVVLSTRGKQPPADVTARMQQQLVQTLGLATASALRLIVNGSVVPEVDAPSDQPTTLNAYVVTGGRFGTMTASGGFSEEPVLGPRIAALDPSAVTVSVPQKLAAVLTGDKQVAVVAATGNPRVVDSRPDLVAPTLDQRGWTYSVTRDPSSMIRASTAKGDRTDFLGLPGGATARSIEVSPDGTRMLVLAESAGQSEAFVAGIQRTADGMPTGLTVAHYVVAIGTSGAGVDATWVDDSSVAVLANSQDNSTQSVRVQQLGAGDLSLGELAAGTSIVGTSSLPYLRVRLQTGDLWTWTNNLWQAQGTKPVNVSVLAVQR